MKRLLPPLIGTALALAACNDGAPSSEPELSTVPETASTSATGTTTNAATSASASSEAAPEPEPESPAPSQPDAASPAAPTEAVNSDGVPLSEIPIADGGTCPAYRCGYGTDQNGNPNPSSGELQTLHGCDDGYITDESLCSAVRGKAQSYGWNY